MKVALAALLVSFVVLGVTSRKLMDADMDASLEHQRILAELEEVHQLRERMLQQAATYTSSSGAPAPAPTVSSPQPDGTTGANAGGAESSSRSTGGVSSESSSVSGGTGSGGAPPSGTK